MWQLFLAAAAAAGSTGFLAKRFLRPSISSDPDTFFNPGEEIEEDADNDHRLCLYNPNANSQDFISQPFSIPKCSYKPDLETSPGERPSIFTFSSSESSSGNGFRSLGKNCRKKVKVGFRASKKGPIIVEKGSGPVDTRLERRKSGRKFAVCLKRRKTSKNLTEKAGFCSSKDSNLFSWGLSFGIIYMMSAGKAEMSKLSKAMNETARVVQELKSELNRRKSSQGVQLRLTAQNIDDDCKKVSDSHLDYTGSKTNTRLRDSNVKIPSIPTSDNGECGSSVLTEEPEQRVQEMDQLEAELECELRKLPSCTMQAQSCEEFGLYSHEDEVSQKGFHEIEGQCSKPFQFQGVAASELEKKLSHLLIEQQENQIVELESELHSAQFRM